MLKLRSQSLAGPYNGLAKKIAFARRAKFAASLYPEVRQFAEGAAGKGERRLQAGRLFRVIKESVNYVGDPIGVEQTKAPWVLLAEIEARGFAAGDCDDQATLAYVLLDSIGIPARLRVAWYGNEDPQHIYAIARLNGEWTAFDTTRDFMGYEIRYTRVKDFE